MIFDIWLTETPFLLKIKILIALRLCLEKPYMLSARHIKRKLKKVNIYYVKATDKGISRNRHGRGFKYLDKNGKKIVDALIIRRIKSLAIPPAYSNVWICPSPHGHIQAMAYDDRRRKQYIYHPYWNTLRNENKHLQMVLFGKLLPSIRRRIEQDLRDKAMSKAKLIAAAIKLLDLTHIRIGNKEYSVKNASHGLTTLHKKHIDVKKSKIHFDFRGKSKQLWNLDIYDAQLAKVIKRCESIPGYELFKYYDEQGHVKVLRSNDINAYLKKITQHSITAKDFRTWAGTVLFIEAILAASADSLDKNIKMQTISYIKHIAKQLGNTPSVCKKSYIHPEIIALHQNRQLGPLLIAMKPKKIAYLSPAETITLHILISQGKQ